MHISPILSAKNISDFDIDKYQDLIVEIAKINSSNIDDELLTHTTYYSYYNGLVARANRLLDTSIISLEASTSEFKNSKRTGAKQSVEALKDLANCDPLIRKQQEEVAKYQEIYSLVKSVCQTLEHKKDMLVQLSANKRMEAKIYA